MGIIACASGSSCWRGLDYYKNNKVKNIKIISNMEYSSIVSGTKGYNVCLNLEKPRSSTCNCPLAKGKRIICKHIVATYFAVVPNSAKAFEKEQAKSIAQNINEHFSKYVNAYYVTTNSVEIISAETNKAQAIYLIMKKNNIDKNNVYTVGDGYSDIEMIKEFNGYKMKNGIEELKQYSVKEVNSVHELIIKIMELQNI